MSRITVTPGNLFFGETVRGRQVLLGPRAFEEVLLVRSFHKNDPLRDLVRLAIAGWNQACPGDMPAVRLVDVQTRDDLVRALNSFDGAVMIFDGHGHHTASDIGELILADEKISAWSLRGDVRMPPVVILSACDTHPFAASHATTANGFLAAGATTVWATAIPISGASAAVLVARLLFRMSMVIPMLLRRPWGSFRWSEILPGLQRRQFVTEALRRLRSCGVLRCSDKEVLEIETATGLLIEREVDRFAYLVESVADMSGQIGADVQSALAKHAYFVEALAYVQIGNPELVVGINDAGWSKIARAAEEAR